MKDYNFCSGTIKTRNLREYTREMILTANRAIAYNKPYKKELYNSAKYLQKRLTSKQKSDII